MIYNLLFMSTTNRNYSFSNYSLGKFTTTACGLKRLANKYGFGNSHRCCQMFDGPLRWLAIENHCSSFHVEMLLKTFIRHIAARMKCVSQYFAQNLVVISYRLHAWVVTEVWREIKPWICRILFRMDACLLVRRLPEGRRVVFNPTKTA